MKIQRNANKSAKEATSDVTLGQVDGVVVNGGGPVNTTNFRKDFEAAAKRLKELIKIGDTTTGEGKTIKSEQLDIDPAGTPNPSKTDKKKEHKGASESVKKNASEAITYQVILGIANDGSRKYYNEDSKDWVDTEKLATKYADLDRCRMDWMKLTEGGRKLPTGFKRIFTPNYSATEAIIDRNTQRRNKKTTESRNSKISKYSKDAYEAVAMELNATIPPEYLNDPSEVNFKKILQIKADKEAEEKRQAELAERKAKAKEAASKIINAVNVSDNKMETLFDLLVPDSGKADTKAGELIRAMMRIQYRDWNDGDVFYEGYGLETAGPSAEYLMYALPELEADFIEISENGYEDDQYTQALEQIAKKVVQHLLENPELFYELNEDDSRDWDTTWLVEHQPTYDFVGDLPTGLADFIGRSQLRSDIEGWEISGHGPIYRNSDEVDIDDDHVTIYGLPKEPYDELESNWDSWVEDYAEGEGFYDQENNEEETADESVKETDDLLDKAYKGSYLTVIGAGGSIEDWKEGLQSMFDREKIGKVSEWIVFNGTDMNTKYKLKGSKAYPGDLTFLACPLDGLDVGKLAMFRLRFDPNSMKWFSDIVDNNK